MHFLFFRTDHALLLLSCLFSPCHNPLCYSAKLSKSSAVNCLINSFFSSAVCAETQNEYKNKKLSFAKVFVCERIDCPSTLSLSPAQSKQGWGEEGILFLKLLIKISAGLFCERSRTASKATGMMQIKQADVQSAGIYSVLHTRTACETQLVRISLKCKLKIKAGTSVFVFYRYTNIFYLQSGSFYC